MPSIDYPPGPRSGLFGMGQLPAIRSDYLGFTARMHREYGDCVHYRLGPYETYQFIHPEQLYEVLVQHNRAFHKPARFRAVLSRWNGNSLLLSEDETWARQRRLAQPAFNPHRLDRYAELIVRHSHAMIDPCRGQEVDLAGPLNQLTFRIVSEALFGADVARVSDPFLKAVRTLQVEGYRDFVSLWMSPLWFPTRRRFQLRRAIRFVDNLAREFIAKWHEQKKDRGDLLSMLLMAKDEEGGGKLSDEQVRDEAVTLIIAGNETTSTALLWTIYLLAVNENVQEEVQREIDWVTGGKDLQAAHAPKLVLTAAVIKEAMRLFSPVYVMSREAVEDVTVGGYTIRKGSQVHLPIHVTHRDPRWFDRAEDFAPHRFLNDGEKMFPRCAYLPFGAGPRACIGRGFAMFEATLSLATMLRQFRLTLGKKQAHPAPIEAQISQHPKDGLWVHVEPR